MRFLNQKYLLYLTLAAGPLYLIKFAIFGLPINLLEIFILLNLSLFVWGQLSYQKTSWLLPPWQITSSLILILIGVIFSISSNKNPLIGLGILKSWFLLPLAFAYLLFIKIKTETEIKNSLLSLYFSTSLVSLIAICYKLAGNLTFDQRLSAFYLSPNYLALYLAPGVLFGFYFFSLFFKKPISFFLKAILSLSLVLNLLALFYTYSYGAWLAVFLALLISSLFYLPKKQFFFTLASVCVLLSVAVFSQNSSPKFSALTTISERSSLASRLTIWRASEKMLFENPFLGIGPGNFQTKYLSLQPLFPPYLEWAVPQPHNLFFGFLVTNRSFWFFGFCFLDFLNLTKPT